MLNTLSSLLPTSPSEILSPVEPVADVKPLRAATLLALNNERVLREHVKAIHGLRKRVAEDVIEIGRRLTELKNLVDHGEWLLLLEREFTWTDRQALNYMRVYEMVNKSEKFSDLEIPVSGLYLLAAPSTPESAREEVVNRTEAGERLSVAEVKDIVRGHKPDSVRNHDDDHGLHGESQHDGHIAQGDTKTSTTKLTRPSILAIWESGDPIERELIRDLVLDEFFATINGADLYERIPADNRKDVIAAFLDRLTPDGLCAAMSATFREQLQTRSKRRKAKAPSLDLDPVSRDEPATVDSQKLPAEAA
jgi:Protein of unknown function (DUF3102)